MLTFPAADSINAEKCKVGEVKKNYFTAIVRRLHG